MAKKAPIEGKKEGIKKSMSVIVSLYHSGFRNNNHPILFIFSWFFNFYFSIYIIPNNFIYRNGKTKKRSNCLRLHIYFSCQIFNISSISYTTFMETKMMMIFYSYMQKKQMTIFQFFSFQISFIIILTHFAQRSSRSPFI